MLSKKLNNKKAKPWNKNMNKQQPLKEKVFHLLDQIRINIKKISIKFLYFYFKFQNEYKEDRDYQQAQTQYRVWSRGSQL